MIIYFTGTGNSRDIATRISMMLTDDDIVELCNETLRSGVISAKRSCEKVVWVFPVYSWGVPPVVAKFIKRADIQGIEDAEHHMVATCGDDAGLIANQWRKLIRNKGWNAASASTVVMPNTYTLMKGFDVDSEILAKQKLEASGERIAVIVERIKRGATDDDVIKGRYAWIKSRIIYPWFIKFAMSPKPFHAIDSCSGCGLCARQCPLGNINMDKDCKRPYWGKECALCLRCYHICPIGAVQYGKATKGKGRYLNKNRS